jgi:cysteine-rich repeat protein
MGSWWRVLGIAAVAALVSISGSGCSEEGGGDPCGNGRLDEGEGCDDGLGNSDTEAGACRTDCRPARCGDGVVDPGEACDDGEGNDDKKADGCRSDCSAARCGDGVRDTGEECDWGAANDDTRDEWCRTNCRMPYCGDGVLGEGEVCDDGAGNSDVNPDACRTDCRPPRCGDGVQDSGEGCDEGEFNDDWTPDACRVDCRLPVCGDGVKDVGEECDDGDREGKDGCDARCRYDVPPGCGNLGIPLHDLREVGRAEGLGFVAGGTLPAGSGKLSAGISCGAPGAEVFYAFPVPAFGNLAVEVEASGFTPAVGVRRSCWSPEVACATGAAGAARLVVPNVHANAGMYFIQVDSADGLGGEYSLTVTLRPPLGAGEECAPDGSLGDCDPVSQAYGCSDPDGDGRGTCVLLVGEGSPCDPAGAENVCREPAVCRDGTCRPSCGDGVRQPWEECDDGNTASGDLCSSSCRLPLGDCSEPVPIHFLWDPELGGAVWSDTTARSITNINGACDAWRGSGLVARFVAPETARFGFVLDGRFALPVLSLLDRCEDPVGRECAFRGGRIDADLQAGQEVFLVVGSSSPDGRDNAGPFTLTVERPRCGDGRVQGTEECDDGNTEAGDRCRPDCTLPGEDCTDVYPLPEPDGSGVTGWSGDLGRFAGDTDPACQEGSGDDAVMSFTAPAAGRYSFDARIGFGKAVIAVSTGTCQAEPPVACAVGEPDRPAVVEATLAAGETAWITVDQSSSWGSGDEFTVRVAPLVCGDGIRARPEECDDGNREPGDGCDADCRVEPVAEREPNDVRAKAQPLAVGRTLAGTLPPEDIDFVSLDLEAGVAYEFETFSGGWERCDAETGSVRMDLRIHGPAGDLLDLEDERAIGYCYRYRIVPATSGTHFLRVEEQLVGQPKGIQYYLLRTGRVEP